MFANLLNEVMKLGVDVKWSHPTPFFVTDAHTTFLHSIFVVGVYGNRGT